MDRVGTVALMRRRDAAAVLAVSERQTLKWEREGLLTAIDVPGIRAVRYVSEEVESLAKRIARDGRRSGGREQGEAR